MQRHLATVAGLVTFLAFLFCVLRVEGLRAQSWPIKFRQNAQTLPSIEVKLSPPDDPLPQVTAEVLLLERSRLELEEGLMAKLEDEYNVQLDNAQKQIASAVERAMSTFNNPAILQGAIKGAMLPRTGSAGGGETEARFQEQDSSEATARHSPLPAIENGAIRQFTSFLQTGETVESKSAIVGDIMAAALAPPPAVKLQLTEVKEPDPQIKEKMDEIEQLRADEESKMFDQAMAEFGQLTQITVAELETNIQIQMNPFLVDKAAVSQAMKRASVSATPGSYSPIPLAFQQIEENPQASPPPTPLMTSFLQLSSSESAAQQAKFGLAAEKQLNVKIAQSEKPYPTIDEIVSEMQKKRDATERLERMKILQLQLKLLRAEGEMIKEALHANVARILAQYAPAIEAIKAETAVRALA